MHARAPLIDPRDNDALVATTEALLQEEIEPYLEEVYQELGVPPGDLDAADLQWVPATAAAPDMAYALVRIFARMVRHVVSSVNRIPDKGFLELLNLVGAAQAPPNAARVPLTFSLADGAPADVLVPAGARVAAPPAGGQTEESVFETEVSLVVTRAALTAVLVHRPDLDRWADRTAPDPEGCPVTEADVPTPHLLFVDGGALFAHPAGTPAEIRIRLYPNEVGVWADLPLSWSYWDGETWQGFPEGALTWEVLEAPGSRTQVISFALPEKMARKVEGGREGLFLRGDLGHELPDDAVVPTVLGVEVGAHVEPAAEIAPDLAAFGASPLDLSMDFRPFGEQPKAGDTFFVASEEAFSKPQALVTLHVERGEAAHVYSGQSSDPGLLDDPVLVWEMWTTEGWTEVGRSSRDDSNIDPDGLHAEFVDGTMAFTEAGDVTIRVPVAVAPLDLRGVSSHWLRVRIARSERGYGRGIFIEYVEIKIGLDDPPKQVKIASVTDEGHRPPVLSSLAIDYVHEPLEPAPLVVTYNDFEYAFHEGDDTAEYKPFTHSSADSPALYLGFDRPFDNRSVALFFDVTPPTPAEISAEVQLAASATEPPAFEWQYSGPEGWKPLDVEDDTKGLRRAAPVRFLGPADFTPRTALDRSRHWIRLRLLAGDFGVVPRLRCVRTNTVWARQATTITDEILGSSDGQAGQVLRVPRTPVLADPVVEVFEPVVPSAAEEQELRRISGDDAVRPALDEHGHATGAWVRWRQVTDFHASGPADRHYVLDHATGTLQLGGLGRGMAPPAGVDNVRVALYRVGGGVAGNRGPGEITTLLNTPTLVAGVTNHTAAAGGTDLETLDRVRERGPRMLRHAHRAVAAEDFEDLAREASPEVARARTVTPRFEALACTLSPPWPPAGKVLVVVVPYGAEAQPVPALSLLDDVADYLRARAAPAVRVDVSGPDWVRVTAEIEIVPVSLDAADTADTAVLAALGRYLHPLTGSAAGEGWEFGAVPRESDLYPLLTAVPEVDHVRQLHLKYERQTPAGAWVEHAPGSAGLTGPAILIFSGQHQVSIRQAEGG